jgi:hypothetical protein
MVERWLRLFVDPAVLTAPAGAGAENQAGSRLPFAADYA